MNQDNQNPLPPLQEIPEFLQGDNWYQEDTTALYLDFTKPYRPPRWTLSHNGVPFAKTCTLSRARADTARQPS